MFKCIFMLPEIAVEKKIWFGLRIHGGGSKLRFDSWLTDGVKKFSL
jgi:hypothetical protein